MNYNSWKLPVDFMFSSKKCNCGKTSQTLLHNR